MNLPETDAAGTVSAVAAAIDAAIDAGESAPSLAALARTAHLSPSHLRRVFERSTGMTPRAYADARRALRLRDSLSNGTPVATSIAEAGFGSSSRVYERHSELLGMTPATFRRGAPGESVTYAIARSRLGLVVVAFTERGVCLVTFGESERELAEEVTRRFPRADVRPATGEHEAWVRVVVELVDGACAVARELPLDIRGTTFQQQVWQALREIPRGSTVTYAQLARAIGRPSATRAVAQACGANPLAVVIPCHRVIGADGSLTGYRWGVARKRELLDREQAGCA